SGAAAAQRARRTRPARSNSNLLLDESDMSDQYVRARNVDPPKRPRESRLAVLVVGAVVLSLGGVAVAGALRGSSDDAVATIEETATTSPAPATDAQVVDASTTTVAADVAAIAPPAAAAGDVAAVPEGQSAAVVDNAVAAIDEPDGCKLATRELVVGESGPNVDCLQKALRDAGFYQGPINATFDTATADAVTSLQNDRGLFVDGEVGRETGKSLGIWPDEESLVVRTPPPPEGAVDTSGFPLSPVAISGDDPAMPPLPPNSGNGRRVVYDRAGQRAWAIDEDDQVIRSWLVTGSQYENEVPGTHEVFSRSEQSTAWNGAAILPLMIRWYPTDRGNLGFHGIPIRVSDGSVYQTTEELGTRLSGGCQRQHNTDAEFMWGFAVEGTTVVVT
ncbi:MAG: L,D-transpeptidase family protein, partial [Ilumatobacteraceae bacterium]